MSQQQAFKSAIESFLVEGKLLEIYSRGEDEGDFAVGVVLSAGDTSFIFGAFRRDGGFADFRWLDYSNVKQVRLDTVYLRQYQDSALPELASILEHCSLAALLAYLSSTHEVCSIDDLEGSETLGIVRRVEGEIVSLREFVDGAANGEVLLALQDVGAVRFGGSVHSHLGSLVK